VTGGAKRVGREISLALAAKGYNIGLHYNSSVAEASAVQAEIKALGVDCVLLKCDLTQTSEVFELMQQATKSLKNIRVLINNASIFEKITFLETDVDAFERNFAVHVRAPFFLCSQFAKICGEGSIVNIVDMMVAKTNPDYFPYLLSKKTLLDLTKMAAVALAPKIRVNAIAPGSVAQPIDEADLDYMTKRAQQIPLKMMGNPAYLMQGIEFLLNNPFITGDCLFIDGGAHL
jgi:pteridine reductase